MRTAEKFHSAMHEMIIAAENFSRFQGDETFRAQYESQTGQALAALQKLTERARHEVEVAPADGEGALQLVSDITVRFGVMRRTLDNVFQEDGGERKKYITEGEAAFDDIFHNYYLQLHKRHELRNVAMSQQAHAIWREMTVFFAVQLAIAGVLGLSVVFFLDAFILKVHTITEQFAMKDALTSLDNRRSWQKIMEAESARSRRYGSPYSLLMIDFDNFKQVNDNYGHQCGDAILRGMAALIVKNVRSSDRVVRYGGEEFLCFLPETDGERAMALAEKVRKLVAGHTIIWSGQSLRVTVSIGVASFPVDGDDAAQLIEIADQRLYAAKKKGRNRVVGLSSAA